MANLTNVNKYKMRKVSIVMLPNKNTKLNYLYKKYRFILGGKIEVQYVATPTRISSYMYIEIEDTNYRIYV